MDANSEKVTVNEEEDRISELPTNILEIIVSLLSLKDAIKTSIVSRRWRYLHTERLHLNFDAATILTVDPRDDDLVDEPGSILVVSRTKNWKRKMSKFVVRVDQIMEQYMMFPFGKRVVSLRICFLLDSRWSWYLDKWILAAADYGVEKLQLLFNMGREKERQGLLKKLGGKPFPYDFPHRFFDLDHNDNKTSCFGKLKHLHVRECVLRTPGDFQGLGHLTTLVLDSTIIVYASFIENLFSNCRRLQDLTLTCCDVVISKFSVTGPLVRCLVHLRILECPNIGEIEICAPSLTTFEYNGNIEKITCLEAPRLETVCFSSLCPQTHISTWLQNFAMFPQLQTLSLRIQSLETLAGNIGSFSRLIKVKHLTLVIEGEVPDSCHPKGCFGLCYLLRAASLLEKLHILFLGGRLYEDLGFTGNDCGWIIESHHQLKEIEMYGYVGNRYVVELGISIMKVATALERMYLSPSFDVYYGNGEFHNLYSGPYGGLHVARDFSWQPWRGKFIEEILQTFAPPTTQVICNPFFRK